MSILALIIGFSSILIGLAWAYVIKETSPSGFIWKNIENVGVIFFIISGIIIMCRFS